MCEFSWLTSHGFRNELIVNHFAMLLRSVATTKPLILETRVAAYVQTILAPDTALWLIMEDFQVDASDAIDIMEESHDIGDLLNPH